MEKHKVVRLSPELKRFINVISLAKYLAGALLSTMIMSMMICVFFVPEGNVKELIRLAFPVSLFMDGAALILACFADMAISAMKWLATHKVSLLVVEEKDVKII